MKATVEYAGAAPGLVSGVIQVNARLPEEIPATPGFPIGWVPVYVQTPATSFYSGYVTIFIAP